MDNLHNRLQRPLSLKEAEDVLRLCDTNKDGVIDKKELMSDLRPSKLRLSREEIREIFLDHDIDGDGYLNFKELTKTFSCLGALQPMFKAQHGMNFADDDGDNLISEDELEKLIDYFEKTNKKGLKRSGTR